VKYILPISYLIRPNQALLTYFAAAPDFALFFGKPLIWVRESHGHRRHRIDEEIDAMKLLFLAQFRTDVLRLKLKDTETVLNELMGDPPFGTDIFDKWWTIEQIDGVEDFNNGFVARIALEQLDLLAPTGNVYVDNWLQYLREAKNKKQL
jgi:hypothetical protein